MHIQEILNRVDHTLLKPESTQEQIRAIVEDGIRYQTASVCIPPSFVKDAAEWAKGRVKICTVIGFPLGYQTTAVKAFEAADAAANGADEIDMVINIGWVKDCRWQALETEIAAIKAACNGKLLKVIIETCLLTDEEKVQMCKIVTAAGADFIKTSTGFSTAGATREDIALFARNVGEGVQMKAAGGIRSLQDAEDFINLGASRLGTSAVVKLVKEGNQDELSHTAY